MAAFNKSDIMIPKNAKRLDKRRLVNYNEASEAYRNSVSLGLKDVYSYK